MDTSLLFNKLKKYEQSRTCFWGRPLIIIDIDNFNKFKEHFSEGIKIGHKMNYRSRATWKHIHAIQHEDQVQFHIDYGNFYRNKILSIPHLFIDIVPFFIWHLLVLRIPYKF